MAEMKQFGIDLELDDTVAQGHYSNLAIISHSTSEFIIDFAAVLPGVQKARVREPHYPHARTRQTAVAFAAGEYRAL